MLNINAGPHSHVIIEEHYFFSNLHITTGEGTHVHIGRGCSFNGTTIVAKGMRKVQIGEDCMFSSKTSVTTSDHHRIFDGNGQRINEDRDVVIGNHVWIGMDVYILKGADIGSGSVIALGSIVTGNIPPQTISGGVPARVLRHGIRWER